LLTQEVGLYTHIRDIVQVLEYEDLRQVILVGHSYAGAVISGVAEEVAHRLARLVFLDAVIPEDGQTVFDSLPVLRESFERRALPGGWLDAPLDPESMGVTDVAAVSWMKACLCPMPFLTHQQPIRLLNADAKNLPRSHIRCTHWALTEALAQHAKAMGWDYHEVPCGHDAMIIMPQELAQVLMVCAGPSPQANIAKGD
jgi:pimeloyl-ACP methyl ester carboxylesterase